MFNYSKIILSYFLASLVLFSSITFANLTLGSPTQPTSYTFIQTADKSVLTPVDKSKNLYKLTLINLQAYTHYISDRPKRITGMMPTEKFFQAWQKQNTNSFAQDAPNVSLSGIELHGTYKNQTLMLMMILSNPKYDAKNNKMTYDAKLIGKHQEALNSDQIKLNNAVMFIDSGWCPGCCCG